MFINAGMWFVPVFPGIAFVAIHWDESKVPGKAGTITSLYVYDSFQMLCCQDFQFQNEKPTKSEEEFSSTLEWARDPMPQGLIES